MSNVSCNIISDILPLYVDEVISEDTRSLVDTHLDGCLECRRKYETMKSGILLPVEGDAKPLRQLKRAWKKEKVLTAMVSVLLTVLLLFTGLMVYENVEIVHDFFSPSILVTMRDEADGDQWKRLAVGETGYLRFDSLFFEKSMVLDGNCREAAAFRIYDEAGNLILDEVVLQPGMELPLKALERRTNYLVEVRTSAEHLIVRFG